MIAPAVVAMALWRGGAAPVILLGFAALRWPLPALFASLLWLFVARLRGGRPAGPDTEAQFLDRLVAELEGGVSPRAALVAIGGQTAVIDATVPARLAAAGLPARQVAGSLASLLPHNGRLVAAAWALAAEVGAAAGPVLSHLARRAAERGRLERERRALTVQARATAWLIAGLPLAALAVLGMTGRIRPGPSMWLVLAGCLLQGLGLGVVWLMVRRAS